MDPIPIEKLVEEAKKDFVSFISTAIVSAIMIAVPSLSWLETPIRYFINLAVVFLVGRGELGVFVLNARVLTSDQAKDYRSAVAKRLLAPDTVSDDEWEEIENEANHYMVQLVRFAA